MRIAILLFYILFGYAYLSAQNGKTTEKFITIEGIKFYRGGQRISKSELSEVLQENAKAFKLYKSAKGLETLAYFSSGIFGFVLGRTLIDNKTISSEALNGRLIVGVGALGIGLLSNGVANSKFKDAIKSYNEGLPASSHSHMNESLFLGFGFTQNGLGIVASF